MSLFSPHAIRLFSNIERLIKKLPTTTKEIVTMDTWLLDDCCKYPNWLINCWLFVFLVKFSTTSTSMTITTSQPRHNKQHSMTLSVPIEMILWLLLRLRLWWLWLWLWLWLLWLWVLLMGVSWVGWGNWNDCLDETADGSIWQTKHTLQKRLFSIIQYDSVLFTPPLEWKIPRNVATDIMVVRGDLKMKPTSNRLFS